MGPLVLFWLSACPPAAAGAALFAQADAGAPEVAALAACALSSPNEPTLRLRALEAGLFPVGTQPPRALVDAVVRLAVRAQLGLEGGADAGALRDWAQAHGDTALGRALTAWLAALRPGARLPTPGAGLAGAEAPGACQALWYLDVGALEEAEAVAAATERDVNLPALGTAWRRLGVTDARVADAKARFRRVPAAWWAAWHGLIAAGRWDEARAWARETPPAPPGRLHADYAPALRALLHELAGDAKAAARERAGVTLRLPAAPAGLFLAAAAVVDARALERRGEAARARAAWRTAREAVESHDPWHPLWDVACAGEGGGTCAQQRPPARRPPPLERYLCR